MADAAKQWLDRIQALPLEQPVKIMNVCGGHERTLTQAAIRSLLPNTIELIPGPGCPVCVCPEEAIATAIYWAMNEEIALVTFGDMLRVPVNGPKNGPPRSLEQARSQGADVRPVASPLDAITIAQQTAKPVVFFAVGFETTMAPIAAMIAQGVPENLSLLMAGRRTWPVVAMLLQSGTPGFDALIAPGHVATIMGANEWQFVVDEYQLPAAVAGFTTESLLAAIYSTLRQQCEQRYFLDNCYGEVVEQQGNKIAQQLLARVFQLTNSNWRGIGNIDQSGYELNSDYQQLDARNIFDIPGELKNKHGHEMPPGCDCAQVVLGKINPKQCRLFAKVCSPQSPVGPCMVSDEGACRIWWQSETES